MASKQDIVMAARSYLGTPYHHQGRVVDGLDCLGLLVMVCRDLDLPHADKTDYGRMPEGGRLLDDLSIHAGRRMRFEDAEPGDILVFRFIRRPRHVAIKTDKGMIHAYAQTMQVVEHGIDRAWQRQGVCAFEFPGIVCN